MLRLPTKSALAPKLLQLPLALKLPISLAECFPRGAGGLAPPVRERWPPARDAVDV